MYIDRLHDLGFDGVFYRVKDGKHIITGVIEDECGILQLSPDWFEGSTKLAAEDKLEAWLNDISLTQQRLIGVGFKLHFHYNYGFYVQACEIGSCSNRDFHYEGAELLGMYKDRYFEWIKYL